MRRGGLWLGVLSTAAVVMSGAVALVAPAATASPTAAVGPAAASAATIPGGYHAVPSSRLLDTRNGTGATAGLRPAGSTIALPVTGVAGIPATGVSAVALTLVATTTAGSGYLTAFPHGDPVPTASALNWSAGRTVSNLTLVKVAADGKVDVRVSGGAAHVVADVVGYVGTPAAAPAAGAVTAVAPTRLLDTRTGTGAPDAAVRGGTVLPLAVAGRGGVPSTGAGSVVLNLTAVGGTSGGYVTASPTDPGSARTSTLNYPAAEAVANLVTVGIGPDGGVDLRVSASGSVELVADVVGWIAPGTPTDPGGATTISPTRLLDTAAAGGGGPVTGGTRRSVHVVGAAGIPPSGVGAVLLNVTVADPNYAGHVQVVSRGAGLPISSSLNFAKGRTKASAVVAVVAANGGVDLALSSGGTARLVVDVTGYVLGPPGDTTPPGQVTGLVATPRAGPVVDVAWAGPAGEVPVTYRVERITEPRIGPAQRQLVGDRLTTPAVADAGVTPGMPTRYAVRAYDAWSNLSAEVTSTVVTVPVTASAPQEFAPERGGFTDVDCPSANWCVAVDRGGSARIWNGSTWSAPVRVLQTDPDDPYGGPQHISCSSTTFCVTSSSSLGSIAVYRSGTWSTTTAFIGGDVSCPVADRCVFITPTGVTSFDGTTFTPAPVGAGIEWTSISCATSTACVMVGTAPPTPGTTWTSHAAVLRAGAWSVKTLGDGLHEVSSVSCPTASFCLAVADAGAFWTFNGTSWSARRNDSDLSTDSVDPHVSCTSSSWCLTDDSRGNTDRWTGSDWVATPKSTTASSLGLASDLSCASPTACLRVDAVGGARAFTGSGWSTETRVDPASGNLHDLSCPSATMCVGVDTVGSAHRWNGTSWSRQSLAADFGLVECPTEGWCLGAWTNSSSQWTFRLLTGTGWSAPTAAPLSLFRLSCPEPGWCMAFDLNLGATAVYSNGSWTTPVALPSPNGYDYFLSCATRRSCVMKSANHHRVWNGSAWSTRITDGQANPTSLDCLSSTWCLSLSQNGWVHLFNGRQWTAIEGGEGTLNSIECVSPTFCGAIGMTDDSVTPVVWGGGLHRIDPIPRTGGHSLISCWSAGRCMVAIGSRYSVLSTP